MATVDVRKRMPSVELSREKFEKRYRSRFADPAFKPQQREFDAIIAAAWDGESIAELAPQDDATPPRSAVSPHA